MTDTGRATRPAHHAHGGNMNHRTALRRGQIARESAPGQVPRKEFARPPAAVFRTGLVETRVWANGIDTPGGWRVDQVRVYPGPGGEARFARTLTPVDLRNAGRGLYLARKWIRRVDARRRWLAW